MEGMPLNRICKTVMDGVVGNTRKKNWSRSSWQQKTGRGRSKRTGYNQMICLKRVYTLLLARNQVSC